MKSLLFSLIIVLSCCCSKAATYYAATNGVSGNTGLSTNSPWPLTYALINIGPSNTIIVMPGTWSGSQIDVFKPGTTLRSQVKWGARLINSPTHCLSTHYANTTIDGFEIAYSLDNGIWIQESDCIVRNCWVHHCKGHAGIAANSGPDSQSGTLHDTLVESNLIEYNGAAGYNTDHGMYLCGTNITVRNNVCRYNIASGIQIWDCSARGSTNVQVYNNLCYGNGHWGLVAGSDCGNVQLNVFGNTFICTNSAMGIGSGGLASITCTNNILLGTLKTLDEFGGTYNIVGDYNLMGRVDNLPLGSHGILTNYAGFVNTNSGLYWLKSNSPARGRALADVCGPVGFFGNAQSSVADIGAFQYSGILVGDTRTLDPSGASGADYWGALEWSPHAQSVGVKTNQFGFALVGTSNMNVVVYACTDLANPAWSPVGTNTLTNGSSYFSDPQWTSYPCRFYSFSWQ